MIETPKGSQVIDEKSGGKFLDNAEVEIDDGEDLLIGDLEG